MRRVLAVAALLLLVAAPSARAGAAEDLDRVVTHAITGWLDRRPELATELGFHAYDSRFVPVTTSSVQADVRWLNDLEARLETIPPQSLTPERRADLSRLAGWIAQQRFVLEEIQPHLHDPGALLVTIENGIGGVLESDLSTCERVRTIAGRLHRVPEMVRSARVLLREPSRPAVLAAITQANESLDLLRRTLPALTRDCREPALQADFAEADTMAVRAIEEFRVALREDLLPRAVEPRPLGAEKLSRLLAAAENETASPDSLLARVEREIVLRRARLGALAGRILPGGDVRGALAALLRDDVVEGRLPGAIALTLDTLRARTRDRNLVTLPPARELEVRWTLVPGRERPAVRLITPGPYDKTKKRTRLVYESAAAIASPGGVDSRRMLLHRSALPWALIHEVLPGRWPLEAQRRTATRIRQAFPAASATEGWCAYAEAVALEHEVADPGPRSQFVAEHRAIERLARAAAALAIQVRGTSDDDEAARLAERALMPRESAARVVASARIDPVLAIAPVLGAWRIAELRERLRAQSGARFSLRRFHDALLAQGPLPLPLAEPGVRRTLDRAPTTR